MNARITLWLLVFLGFWINDMFKINVNIVITRMVKQYELSRNLTARFPNNLFTYSHKSARMSPLSSVKQITFDWNESEQDSILSSFFWIHWVSQLPGGILAHYYGAKVVFGMSVLLGAIANMLIPFAAKMDMKALIAVKLFQGFVGGVTWPLMASLTAQWTSSKQRSIFLTSSLGGSAGWFFTYISSVYIADKFSWQYVFYIQSIIAVIWCISWKQLVYDNPSQHPGISTKEKAQIMEGVRKAGLVDGQNALPIPWQAMLTSKAVWANFIACFGTLWGLFTLFTLSQSFLRSVHGLDQKSAGIFYSICYLAKWLFTTTFAIVGSHQQIIPVQKIRKTATFLCTIGAGSMILLASLSSCNVILAMSALALAIILLGLQGAGPRAIFIHISPNFAGVLAGVSGSAGAISGLLNPVLLTYLMKNDQTAVHWQILFSITAFICCVGGIANLFFGTTKVQPWNSSGVKESSQQSIINTQLPL